VSSFCSEGGCVGVEIDADEVRVVDTKDGGSGPALTFTHMEWRAFLAGIRANEFDLDGDSAAPNGSGGLS
jgi:hypothetical protein